MNRILFLSSVDFKEKSIQVIRKTPEAYVAAGWDVHYVVGRDTSATGDYFYERVFDPAGMKVYRFLVPLARIHSLSNNGLWRAFWFRIRNVLLVLGLALNARKVVRDTGEFDVIYGYELYGVLAARLLRFMGYAKKARFVIRFQGVLHVKEWLRLNQKIRVITNPDAIWALKTRADLTIMTNDGSQGLDVLRQLRAPANKTLFLVNGVDVPQLKSDKSQQIQQLYPNVNFHFLSISRLDAHKRIDRGIRIIEKIVHHFRFEGLHYTVIGGGSEKGNLEQLIKRLKLTRFVTLLGPVEAWQVPYHINQCNFLISMYTSSNVGNPLLESIRMGKPVVTLNNGDTATWITHQVNGLIYDVDDQKDLSDGDYLRIATDILETLKDPERYEQMVKHVKFTAQEKLWTWDARFEREITEVKNLIQQQ